MKTFQQVENELREFIEKFSLADKLSVEMVKEWVYEENGDPLEASHKCQDKFF